MFRAFPVVSGLAQLAAGALVSLGCGLMADRDDPKLPVRPLSELKPAAPAATGEDPLTELLDRIMSGRPIVDPTPATGGKTVPVSGAVGSDVAPANDLETKLLNDLEAVSSAFYAHPPPAAPAPPAKPATPAPTPAAAAPHPEPQPAASAARTPVAPPVCGSAGGLPGEAGSSAGASGNCGPASVRKAGADRIAAAV